MSAEITRGKMVPFWKIWANPIVKRYARSRLRPANFAIMSLVILLIAGFLFFSGRSIGSYRSDLDIIDAARIPIIPLFFLQGIIFFMFGTGQVAAGMTGEADEGVLDYQKLAPMTPLTKVIGYLFGLPIREWVIFALTLPFSIWSMVQGQVPLQIALQLYVVFIAAGILYHLTGLLAGTVMKNRRWAFLGSMGMVFLLYTVIPQISKFGLVYFKYITVMPVAEESMPFLIERRSGQWLETYQEIVPTARFFELNFPQAIFTLVSQGVLIGVILTMLWRRWRRDESHLLGKIGAVGLFAWIQAVLLGNALPLISRGDLFPSQEFNRRFARFGETNPLNWSPAPSEALLMIAAFGIVTLIMIWLMTFIITPEANTQIRGWRRARKLGHKRPPFLSDSANSTLWVIIMAGLGTWGWVTFAQGLINSKWFPEHELETGAPLAFGLILLSGGLILQSLLEWKGRKFTALMVILGGVVPVMIGTVAAIISDSLLPLSTWTISICPIAWPAFAAGISLPLDDIPRDILRAGPKAFWFWQAIALLLSLKLLWELRKYRKGVAEATR